MQASSNLSDDLKRKYEGAAWRFEEGKLGKNRACLGKDEPRRGKTGRVERKREQRKWHLWLSLYKDVFEGVH